MLTPPQITVRLMEIHIRMKELKEDLQTIKQKKQNEYTRFSKTANNSSKKV